MRLKGCISKRCLPDGLRLSLVCKLREGASGSYRVHFCCMVCTKTFPMCRDQPYQSVASVVTQHVVSSKCITSHASKRVDPYRSRTKPRTSGTLTHARFQRSRTLFSSTPDQLVWIDSFGNSLEQNPNDEGNRNSRVCLDIAHFALGYGYKEPFGRGRNGRLPNSQCRTS